MAKFMDVHSGFFGVTADQLKAAHEADLAIEKDEASISSAPGSTPMPARSSASRPDPRANSIMRIHERAGHPTAEVYELPIEV